MYQRLSAPASVGGVLDNGFALLKAGFKQVFPVALIPSLVGLVPSATMQVSSQNAPGGLFLLATLISLVISMWTFGAVVARLSAVQQNQPMSTSEALRIGFRLAPRLIVASLLYGAAIGVASLALIIPGIILAVTLWFGPYLIVTDNRKVIDSLSYSHKLVWGDWSRTSMIMLVAVFIAGTTYLLVAFVALGSLAGSEGEVTSALQVFQVIAEVAITVILFPVTTALTLAVLNDLKLRREGADLERRLDELTVEER